MFKNFVWYLLSPLFFSLFLFEIYHGLLCT